MLRHRIARALAGLAGLAALAAFAGAALADTDQSFSPTNGSTTKITANATPTSVAANLATAGAATKLRVCNNGTVAVFIHPSVTASPTATTSDMPLLSASCLVIDGNLMTAAAVLSSTTTAVDTYWTWGAGGL